MGKRTAAAKEQGEPKETRADEFKCKYCGKSIPVIEWATYNRAHAKCQGATPTPPQDAEQKARPAEERGAKR